MLWAKGKITLVTLVWLEKPCFENYVEMVAGLPRNEQKMKIFCKSNKRSYGVYKHIKTTLNQIAMLNFPTDLKSNPVVPLQTNPPGSSRFVGKIRFPVC